jgi:hypothetical protein
VDPLEHLAPEALRRLDGAQLRAVDGGDDDLAVDPLHGVGDRQHRDHRLSAAAEGGDDALDHRHGGEAPRRVVDEHVSTSAGRAASAARTESCRSAPPATTTTSRSRSSARTASSSARGAATTTGADVRGAAQAAHGVQQQRLAGEQAQRLGRTGPEPHAAAGGGTSAPDGHGRLTCGAAGASRRGWDGRRPLARRTGALAPAGGGGGRRRPARRRGRPKTRRPFAVVSTLVTRTRSSVPRCGAAALDHDHRAVVEVADGLPCSLPGLSSSTGTSSPGGDRRPQGQGQRVQVQHPDAREGGDPGETGVEGQQGHPAVEADPHELGVDLGHGRDVHVQHLDLDAGLAAQRLEDLEAAAALGPAQVVPGVGQSLQLAEHGRRDEHRAVQEARPHDVEDAAVDRHGRVDDAGQGGVRGAARGEAGPLAEQGQDAGALAHRDLRAGVAEHHHRDPNRGTPSRRPAAGTPARRRPRRRTRRP